MWSRFGFASVTDSFWTEPPRFTSRSTVRPAGVSRTTRASCAALQTSWPPKRTITSPSLTPAFSAAEPSWTSVTTAPRSACSPSRPTASASTSSSETPRRPPPPAIRHLDPLSLAANLLFPFVTGPGDVGNQPSRQQNRSAHSNHPETPHSVVLLRGSFRSLDLLDAAGRSKAASALSGSVIQVLGCPNGPGVPLTFGARPFTLAHLLEHPVAYTRTH